MTGSVPTPNPARKHPKTSLKGTRRLMFPLLSAQMKMAVLHLVAPWHQRSRVLPKAAGKAKAVAKAASPEPPPKVAGPEKLSVFDAETNLNFVEDDDWAQLAEHPNDTSQKVLEAVLLAHG